MFHSVLRALRSASSLATRGSCQSEGSSRSFAVWAPFSARQLAACVNFERAQSWRTTLTLSAAVCRADDAQLSSLLVVQGLWTVVACMPAQTRLSDPRSKGGYCAQHLLNVLQKRLAHGSARLLPPAIVQCVDKKSFLFNRVRI